jgi:hypothetical protein
MSASFFTIQNRLALKRSNRESYVQILGEHAEQMCELVKCRSKRELLTIGVRIDHLSEEWVNLATRSVRPDSEYAVTASRLIHAFSNLVCDYILDHVDLRKMADIVNLEARFFGGGSGSSNVLNQWVEYTASIVNIANYGNSGKNCESEQYYQLCTECIRRAQILGSALQRGIGK